MNLERYKLAEPIFLRNLVVHPVECLDCKTQGSGVLTLDETIDNGHAEIQELENPDINEILLENKGDDPILLLDGEEMVGALQNRIIAMSNLVAARTSKTIPVICAEEGRWDEIGGFRTGYCSYPGIRAILALKKPQMQQNIWNEIDRKLTSTKTTSATSSMHDIYDGLQDEVARYVEDFRGLDNNTTGLIGVAGNRILGCDILSDPGTYGKFESKLIRSYVIDAIEHQRTSKGAVNVERFFKDTMLAADKQLGKKVNFNIKGPGFVGQGITRHKDLIHLSAFPR
jgi:hypothetical protein